MRAADATRHQAISTWIIELLTVLLTAVAIAQYLIASLETPPFAAITTIALFGAGLGFIRSYLFEVMMT